MPTIRLTTTSGRIPAYATPGSAGMDLCADKDGKNGRTRRKKYIDLTGDTYGRLTVIELSEKRSPSKHVMWVCQCECGNTIIATSNHLRTGTTKSCGCLNKETRANLCRSRVKHGNARRGAVSPEYMTWCNMISRCSEFSEDHMHYYDRGISVCDRWLSFENFLSDMGRRPQGLSIDRIDNDKVYEPGNCRWATWRQQLNNKSTNRYIEVDGENISLADASRRYGLNYNTLRSRVYIMGMSGEQAIHYGDC